MIEAMQGIAIFLDDHQAYDAAMTRFLDHVPAYIYLRSDGQYPKVAPGHNIHTPKQIQNFWHGQKKFWADGICQETCRDFSHSSSGISSIAHVIETSLIQGIDLYDHDVGLRLQHALEFHTHQEQSGETADWLCKGRLLKGFAPGQYL